MKVLFLDAGHGALDPNTGLYTTAPGKMWTHPKEGMHNGKIFYEGVSNRQFCDKIKKEAIEKGITVVTTYHDWKDNSLNSRSDIANMYHKTIQEGIFLSMHSNAVNKQDQAEGFSVWTTKGNTKSDLIASAIFDEVRKSVALKWDIKMRADKSDGDSDYEADFAVLANTVMPSVLIENLFFDNYKDSLKLINNDYQVDVAKAIVNAILPSLKTV